MQSTLTLQQKFHPTMKSSLNLRPGSCHLNQVQDAMTSPLAERMEGGFALIYFQNSTEGLTHALIYLYCWVPWNVALSLMFATEVIFFFKALLWGAETRNNNEKMKIILFRILDNFRQEIFPLNPA